MAEITDDQLRTACRTLDSCLYAVIATVNDDGTPWNAPVFFCRDSQNNLYWASALESQHSQNILRSPRAHIVVFDPNVPWGHGNGVYFDVQVAVIENESEAEIVRGLRMQKVGAANQSIKDFFDPSPRRLFKAIPTKAWINTDTEVSGVTVDRRLLVPLNALTLR